MNPAPRPDSELIRDLGNYHSLCEAALELVTRENQVLAGAGEYPASDFDRLRKDLLPRLETAFTMLRGWRQCGSAPPTVASEAKSLVQAIQCLMMRILLLDRENQQALLRRGLVPASHLSLTTGRRQDFVSRLYRRHSVA